MTSQISWGAIGKGWGYSQVWMVFCPERRVGQNLRGFDGGGTEALGEERGGIWRKAFGAVNEEAWELTGVLRDEVFWKVVERWAVGSETVRGRREAPGKRGETVEGAKQSAWICRNGREHGGAREPWKGQEGSYLGKTQGWSKSSLGSQKISRR